VGKFRVWAGMALALAAATLVGCGGKGGSGNTANVRLVNATLTHASITLLANSTSVIAATPIDTVSSYSGVSTGSPALQINDATSGTVLATTAPSLAGGQHYALVAYESGGTLRTTVIGEDTAAPVSGTAVLRLFNTATDAGAIDVYVTDPSVDISTLSSPTFSFAASSSTQASAFLSFAPGTYRIQVTGAGNTSDLRLDMGSITLASQQIDTVIVTPTTGGTLANGSVLVQQGVYTASRNTNSRVRLAAAVSGNALVTATAGAPLGNIGLNVVAPSVGGYVVVPAGSAIAVGVNGNSVGSPVGALNAGSDNTLLVYGNPAAAVASIVVDDNHLPALSTNLKIRMLNGLTGASPPPLTLEANFAIVANNVLPGTASAYSVVAVVTASTTSLAVYSPNSVANLYPGGSGLTLPPNAVYTLFMLGDQGTPLPVLRKDR
jgi:hypothetical protein